MICGQRVRKSRFVGGLQLVTRKKGRYVISGLRGVDIAVGKVSGKIIREDLDHRMRKRVRGFNTETYLYNFWTGNIFPFANFTKQHNYFVVV